MPGKANDIPEIVSVCADDSHNPRLTETSFRMRKNATIPKKTVPANLDFYLRPITGPIT